MASFCAKCGAEEPGHGDMTMDLPTGSMVTALYATSESKNWVLSFLQGRDEQRRLDNRYGRRRNHRASQRPAGIRGGDDYRETV